MVWRNPFEKTVHDIKREVMTHFAYHHMYELCDENLFTAACKKLRKDKVRPTFYAITGLMKEMSNYGKENL